jgi:hypothetical protein
VQLNLPSLPVRIVGGLLVLTAIGYYAFRSSTPGVNGQLNAPATIDSVELDSSPEMAGKVMGGLVEAGKPVRGSDAALRLNDDVLHSERQTAEMLESAQARHDSALDNALVPETSSRLGDVAGPSEVAASKAALDEAVRNLDEVSSRPDSADFLEIEATLQQASLALRNDVLDRIHGASEGQQWQDPGQEQIDPADAQEAYEDAQKDYDEALTTEAAKAVLKARAEVMVAQQNYDQSVAGGTSQR